MEEINNWFAGRDYTKEEKQEIFDWFLLNFDKYVSCKLYDASGNPINIDNMETYDDYEDYDDYIDIRWDLMEKDFIENFNFLNF